MIISGSDFELPTSKGEKVLLVNPPVYDYQYWSEWSQPAGLLRVGSLLIKKGYKVELIDFMEPKENRKVPFYKMSKTPKPVGDIFLWQYHYGMSYENFESRLNQFHDIPKKIFITSIMTYWWESTRDVISLLRKKYPTSEIYVGGIYPTLCPNHAQENLGKDVFIVKGEIPEASNLSPDLSLYQRRPDYSIITTSRGCPFKCAYCAQRIINSNRICQREPEEVVNEIEEKVKLGIKEFAFYEDSLLFKSDQHLDKILDLLIQKDFKLKIYAPEGMDPKFLNQELLIKMKKAGWQKIHLGFENIYNDVRYAWDRKNSSSNEIFESTVDMCVRAGFKLRSPQINAFVLYGVPGEKIEDVVDTVLYLSHIVGSLIPMLFTPVPGSTLYDKYSDYFEDRSYQLEDLNGKLLPFVDYNNYQASDYTDLMRLMFILNRAVRGESFDLLSSSVTSSLVRKRANLLVDNFEELKLGHRIP